MPAPKGNQNASKGGRSVHLRVYLRPDQPLETIVDTLNPEQRGTLLYWASQIARLGDPAEVIENIQDLYLLGADYVPAHE